MQSPPLPNVSSRPAQEEQTARILRPPGPFRRRDLPLPPRSPAPHLQEAAQTCSLDLHQLRRHLPGNQNLCKLRQVSQGVWKTGPAKEGEEREGHCSPCRESRRDHHLTTCYCFLVLICIFASYISTLLPFAVFIPFSLFLDSAAPPRASTDLPPALYFASRLLHSHDCAPFDHYWQRSFPSRPFWLRSIFLVRGRCCNASIAFPLNSLLPSPKHVRLITYTLYIKCWKPLGRNGLERINDRFFFIHGFALDNRLPILNVRFFRFAHRLTYFFTQAHFTSSHGG